MSKPPEAIWGFDKSAGFTNLKIATNGSEYKYMCCICFEYKNLDELYRDCLDGKPYDICIGQCALEAGLT